MIDNYAQQLINRRTEDGKWLQGCEHTTILLNRKIKNKIIYQTTSDLKNNEIYLYMYSNFGSIRARKMVLFLTQLLLLTIDIRELYDL